MKNWKHLYPGRTRYRRYATKNKIRAQKLTGLYGRFFICCIREIILESFVVVYILKNSKMTGYLPFTHLRRTNHYCRGYSMLEAGEKGHFGLGEKGQNPAH
ncbi:hypothetical protein HF866_10360 [Lactobacillus ruminis]|nr:hypothetical protein [Ligilactobacillus ruminis]